MSAALFRSWPRAGLPGLWPLDVIGQGYRRILWIGASLRKIGNKACAHEIFVREVGAREVGAPPPGAQPVGTK